jgi:RNA polymerase sigma factor (sigma-70 family)
MAVQRRSLRRPGGLKHRHWKTVRHASKLIDITGARRGNLAQNRNEIIAWVGSNIVPHEADLRSRLRRMSVSEHEIGDIVQDAYVRISQLASVDHIRNGRAYLFQTARTVLLQKVRRERIVRIDALTEMETLGLQDDDPGPERRASARQELERVRALISALPDRCREIFELRRIQGMPQREIATLLNLPEHTIEAQATRGLKLLLKAIAEGDADDAPPQKSKNGHNSGSRRNG